MKKTSFVLLPLAAFISGAVVADEADNLDVIEVVSDNLSPQKASLSAGSLAKVRQATTTADILRSVPGVNVNGARSVVQRYSIRGVSEEYLTVTVDGARQNGYAFHHAGNYGIDPDILKRVNVDVGANSVVTGAGSLGGAIRFETVEAADLLADGENFGAKFKWGYGSNADSNQAATTLYGRAGGLDVLGYFNYRHQENGKDGNGVENANKGHLSNYLFKAKYNIDEAQWVKFSAERYDNTALSCATANFACAENSEKKLAGILRKTYTVVYGYAPSDNPLLNVKANFYNTKTVVSAMDADKSRIRTVGGTLSNVSEIDIVNTHHSITVGGEYYSTKSLALGARPDQRIKNFYDASVDSTSIYLEDKIAVGDFIITPGVRYDYYQADLSKDFDKSYKRFSKALGLKYLLTDDLAIFANYTEIFKGPDVGEVFLSTIPTNYHPSIDAIRGNNKEAGFSFVKADIFGNDDFSLTAKYFQTKYNHFNTNIPSERSEGSAYQDIGEVKVKGVEVSTAYRINNFSINAGYARARSEQLDPLFGFYNLTALPDTGDKYTLGLSYVLPDYGVELGWNTIWVRSITVDSAERKDRTQNSPIVKKETYKESYSVSNVYATWSPKQLPNLELTAGIDNIFDKAYVDQATKYYSTAYPSSENRYIGGDYELGRNYKFTVSYKF